MILNTWEAVYFDHDYDTLKALADKAGDSGVERFVVDDGWFGSRRDSTSGLGDWQIAQDVWPDGPKSLKALADYVHGKGMEFGLWFEPEMVNPDSDVARAHPDWVLRPTANRLPMQGRSQQVLDLTNPDAYRYIHDSIDALVGELGIDYIKWDHNKFVTEAVSPRTGRPAVHGQTLAVYRMFRDLEVAHPGLEIESCASGGRPYRPGILDSPAACGRPTAWTRSSGRYSAVHVAARAALHDGRACGGESCTFHASRHEPGDAHGDGVLRHMGVEWNLLKEPDEALNKLGEWVAEYKRHRAWFAIDTCVHADIADPAVRVDGMVKPDRSAAFYRFTQLTTSQTLPAAPDSRARVLTPSGTTAYSRWSGSRSQRAWSWQRPVAVAGWTKDGVLMTGRALMTYGLRPPSLHPAQSVLFTAIRQ